LTPQAKPASLCRRAIFARRGSQTKNRRGGNDGRCCSCSARRRFLAAAMILGLAPASAEEAEEAQDRRDLRLIAVRSPAAARNCTRSAPRSSSIIFIKQGGVAGYQLEAIYADAQSKPDVAINEAVRLVEQ